MSNIWDKIDLCSDALRYKMEMYGKRVTDPKLDKFNWENHIFKGPGFRRAHVEIVDQRENHGLFILHATVFSNLDNDAPIWGFDVVSGKNKITGAFHDFSITTNSEHTLYKWFSNKAEKFEWSKERKLPEWAEAIFSPSMVAAGNIQDLDEADRFISLGLDSLSYYLEHCKHYVPVTDPKILEMQNRYCRYQKMNPRVLQSMVAMGYDAKVVETFVDEILFPEIN